MLELRHPKVIACHRHIYCGRVADMPLVRPALTVADVAAWAQWLTTNRTTSTGVWLTLAKKDTAEPTSLTYAQALDEALCHGWIDGQRRKQDDTTYAQSFTPRATKSSWSKRNVTYIARLEAEGRMTCAGRAAVDAAKSDGRWDAAYAGSATAEMQPEFLEAVAADTKAQAMWDSLTKPSRYAIYYQLICLKTEAGRQKRIQSFVSMLARGETAHLQKDRSGKRSRSPATRARAPRRRAKAQPASSVKESYTSMGQPDELE